MLVVVGDKRTQPADINSPARCSRAGTWIMKGVHETFSRYDNADYLKTEADITAYLEACAEEAPNDPVFMLNALGTVARARNMSQLVEAAGMAPGRPVQGVVG